MSGQTDALVDQIVWLFWLKLQDYIPGMDHDDWQQVTERMRPEIVAVLAAGDAK